PKQILTKYEQLMRGHINCPIPLEFRKVKCLNCSEETDPRLANPKCHLEKRLIHIKPLKAEHGEPIGKFHTGLLVEKFDHSLKRWTVRVATKGLTSNLELEDVKWSCCDKKLNSEG